MNVDEIPDGKQEFYSWDLGFVGGECDLWNPYPIGSMGLVCYVYLHVL